MIKAHPIAEIKNQNDDSIQKLLELPKAKRFLSTKKTKTLNNVIKGIKSLSRLVDKLSDQPRPNSQQTVDSNSSSNELSMINSRKPPNSPRKQSPNRKIALISPVSDIGTSGSTQFQQTQNSVSNNSFNNSNISEPMMNAPFPGDISLIRGPNRQMPQNVPNQSTPYQQRPYIMRPISQPIYNPPLNQPLNAAMPVRYVIRQVNQIQGNPTVHSRGDVQQFISQIPRPNISNGQISRNQSSQYPTISNHLLGSSFSSQASTPSPAPNQMNQPRPRNTVPGYQMDDFQMRQNDTAIQNQRFRPIVPQRTVRPTMDSFMNNNMPLEVQRRSEDAERQVNETRKKWRNAETRPLVEFR